MFPVLKKFLHTLNVIAFLAVLGFVMDWMPMPLELFALAICINIVFAALAIYRLAAGRPKALTPVSFLPILIGVCYIAAILLVEWRRVK
jgi:hypothetical protein